MSIEEKITPFYFGEIPLCNIQTSGYLNSCFYFSTSRAIYNITTDELLLRRYLSENNLPISHNHKKNMEQYIVHFRNKIKSWITALNNRPVDQCIEKINTNPDIVKLVFLAEARSPYRINFKKTEDFLNFNLFNPFDKKEETITCTLGFYVINSLMKNPLHMKDFDVIQKYYIWKEKPNIKNIIETYLESSSFLSTEMLENILFKNLYIKFEELIDRYLNSDFHYKEFFINLGDLYELKNQLYLTCINFSPNTEKNQKAYDQYMYVIHENLSKQTKLNLDFLLELKIFKEENGELFPVKNSVKKLCNLILKYVKIFFFFIDDVEKHLGKKDDFYFDKYSHSDLENKTLNDLNKSISLETGNFFSSEQILKIKRKDPRYYANPDNLDEILVQDDFALSFPLNINFFNIGQGIMIETYPSRIFNNKLADILNTVNPSSGRDAGDEDIIPIMPYYIQKDIYIINIRDKLRLESYYEYKDKKSNNGIILCRHGNLSSGHFETVGLMISKTEYITEFTYESKVLTMLRNLNG